MPKLWRNSKETMPAMTANKIMPHDEFLKRIRKTFYVGGNPSSDSSFATCQTISKPLAHYAAEIFSETHRGYSLNRLNYVTVANLNATPCSLILAMIYLDRLQDVDPMYSRKITPTELFLVSMLVSTKFYCGYDEDVYVSEWAEQGDISQDRLQQLELEFLCALNWSLYVSNGEFFAKLEMVERELARRQGVQRGWLTYTELTQLIPSLAIAKAFLQYSTIFTVSYAASVFTIAGAFFLASQVPGTALYCCSKTTDVQAKPATDIGLNSNSTVRTVSNNALDTALSTDDNQQDLDETLDRLKYQHIQDDEDSFALPTLSNNQSIGGSIMIRIPLVNTLRNFRISRSGINYRSFLDNDTDKSDVVLSDGGQIIVADNLTELSIFKGPLEKSDDSTCSANRDGLFLFWMKFI